MDFGFKVCRVCTIPEVLSNNGKLKSIFEDKEDKKMFEILSKINVSSH